MCQVFRNAVEHDAKKSSSYKLNFCIFQVTITNFNVHNFVTNLKQTKFNQFQVM